MKNLMIIISTLFVSSLAFANHCDKYAAQPEVITAIQVVAKEMKYSFQDLCNQSRIGDIYAAKRVIYSHDNQPIPHVWVNLHYWSYTCQYFVRESDHVITKANCYNGT